MGVVPCGPSGIELNSSFATRGAASYKEDLGAALVNFARVVPDGLLVFFPSYSVLADCLAAWKTPRAGARALGAGGAGWPTAWQRGGWPGWVSARPAGGGGGGRVGHPSGARVQG